MLQFFTTNVSSIIKNTTISVQNIYVSHNKFYQYRPKAIVNMNNHNTYQFVNIIKHLQIYLNDTYTN